MSFWPRLRRRSRGRRRPAKANPYASRDIDKYRIVHEELQTQRAQFASEKGVSVELVRFVSRSSRGWVYFPSETPSASTSPRPSRDGSITTIPAAPDASEEFCLPPPAVPLPQVGPAAAGGDGVVGTSRHEAESSSVGNLVMGLDPKGDSRNLGRLVISRRLKDEAWMQISKTAALLYVKVLVFSRALGASSAFAVTFAVVVDIWNRGKGTLYRVFSALATQLLTTLKPDLSLQQSKAPTTLIRAPPRPVPEQPSASNAMKVLPFTEDSNAENSRASSFAFPVLTKQPSSSSPTFPVHQPQQADSTMRIGSPAEEISLAPSPLLESNKLQSARSCQKLKSKLFKNSPARKGENSSPSAEAAQSNDPQSSSCSSCNVSPARGKSCKKRASCISRAPIHGSEEEYYEVEQPPSSLKPAKRFTRSHELLFFRSPNGNRRKEMTASKEIAAVSAVPSARVQNLSRSQELKLSLKNLGKKKMCRSQEFTTSAAPCQLEDLALPTSTVEGLESLAFPFKAEGQVRRQESPSRSCSPRQSPPPRRRSSLSKLIAVEPPHKSSNRGLDSPRSSTGSAGGSSKGRKSRTTASSYATSVNSSKSSAMLAAAELKPTLRKVRTAVSMPAGSEQHDLRRVVTAVSKGPPLPSESGELGRSKVLSPEILGSILLLAILVSLLLGRIPAIVCTSCLCLILSHLQRFFNDNLTPKDMKLLKRSSGISRLHHASSSPAYLPNGTSTSHGSPFHEKSGLQSSEYRKRVLIEGLLERSNRRGATL